MKEFRRVFSLEVSASRLSGWCSKRCCKRDEQKNRGARHKCERRLSREIARAEAALTAYGCQRNAGNPDFMFEDALGNSRTFGVIMPEVEYLRLSK